MGEAVGKKSTRLVAMGIYVIVIRWLGAEVAAGIIVIIARVCRCGCLIADGLRCVAKGRIKSQGCVKVAEGSLQGMAQGPEQSGRRVVAGVLSGLPRVIGSPGHITGGMMFVRIV